MLQNECLVGKNRLRYSRDGTFPNVLPNQIHKHLMRLHHSRVLSTALQTMTERITAGGGRSTKSSSRLMTLVVRTLPTGTLEFWTIHSQFRAYNRKTHRKLCDSSSGHPTLRLFIWFPRFTVMMTNVIVHGRDQ